MSKITFLQQKINEDGVLKEVILETRVPNEPNFIKLYLEHVTMLSELPKWVSPVLMELLKYTNYDNKIILNSSIKKQMADNLKMAYKSIDNSLVKLTKSEILIREDKGIYLANPYIFGKGKWEKIREIRTTIQYHPDRKTIVSSEIVKD